MPDFVGIATDVKKYYIYFNCSGCDIEYGIRATDDVEMELIGVSRFTCKQCGVQTEWVPHNISKLQMPFLYEKYDADDAENEAQRLA